MNPMVKRRDMLVQVFLFVITFGIYGIYWFYQTSIEMKELAGDPDASPGLWTVLLFIPPLTFYSHYKYADLFEDISDEELNRWILFILWIVFAPAVWFIVQTELNRKAGLNPAMA
jgi:Domain of unknown function (DUF4234)